MILNIIPGSFHKMMFNCFKMNKVLNHVLQDCQFSHAVDDNNIWTKVEKNGKRSDTYTVINTKMDITFKLDTVKRVPEVGWSLSPL